MWYFKGVSGRKHRSCEGCLEVTTVNVVEEFEVRDGIYSMTAFLSLYIKLFRGRSCRYQKMSETDMP